MFFSTKCVIFSQIPCDQSMAKKRKFYLSIMIFLQAILRHSPKIHTVSSGQTVSFIHPCPTQATLWLKWTAANLTYPTALHEITLLYYLHAIRPIHGFDALCFFVVILNSFLWDPCELFTLFVRVNSSPPGATYIRQWTGTALVHVMACRLFGAKPLSEPMLGCYQLDP